MEYVTENLDLNQDNDLLTMHENIKSIGEEVTKEEELFHLLKSFKEGKKENIYCYDGFEPSGKIHIAQGLLRAINVNKFTKHGIKFKFWVADWFAQMNLKFGGDLKKIQKAGKLMIHIWKACGMDMDNVEFIWASESINNNSNEYWQRVLDISRNFSISRIKKCTTIMGKTESDDLMSSQLLYPIMQCADIFHLNVDICSLGVDQRKVNMLAREYSSKLKKKFPPIIISHHMLMGLDGSDKMSKSNPDNAIFMDDNINNVKRKINKAYCEPGNSEKNPILEYFKYIVFQKEDEIVIDILNFDTKEIIFKKYLFNEYQNLHNDFKNELIHPSDLKKSLIKYLNQYLEPVRKYLDNNNEAKELLKSIK